MRWRMKLLRCRMDFFWTPAELAFAVPLGVIIAAIVNFWAARFGGKSALKVQAIALAAARELSHDQRLWDKRSDSYTVATTSIFKLIEALSEYSDPNRALKRGLPEISEMTEGVLQSRAMLSLFGGSDVMDSFGPIYSAIEQLHRFAATAQPHVEKILYEKYPEDSDASRSFQDEMRRFGAEYSELRFVVGNGCITMLEALRTEIHRFKQA